MTPTSQQSTAPPLGTANPGRYVRFRPSEIDVGFEDGDVLLFGPEPTGLSEEVLSHARVTDRLRIPMVGGRRSLNLANSAAVAMYEAWRQQGFPGAE